MASSRRTFACPSGRVDRRRSADRAQPGDRLRLSETCRRVAEVYAEQASFLLPVALVLFVPLGLVDAAGEHLAELESEGPSAGEVAGLALAVAVAVAGGALGEVFYAGVAMAAVTESMEGRPRATLGGVMRRLPYGALLVVDVLFSLGLAVGIVLLVVPGVLFFVRYVLAAPLLEIERRGVREAFRRSGRLTRGHRAAVLLLLGGLWLVTDGLTSLLQEGGLWTLGDTFLADWAIAVMVAVVVTPVWAVAVCVVAWRLLQLARGAREPAPVA